jgi:hypothetical protein
MSEFRTEVKVQKSSNEVAYNGNVLLIGSCFSDNIGRKLEGAKFPTRMNPLGVLYNPVSVANGLRMLIEKSTFTREDLEWHQGTWHSFYHHSSFSDPDAHKCLENINDSIVNGHSLLKKASHLFITFGTTWVFERKRTGKIVSNCHKLPSKEFNRYSLDLPLICKLYSELIQKLKSFNPHLHIVFTISPIRHWKDGPVENQRSKAKLITAVSELCNDDQELEYFPSYEIMMDDLRDYRFYAEDMLHPNNIAIDYIWTRFKETFMSVETQKLIREIEKLTKASSHRPFNVSSEEHQKFIVQTLKKIELLERKHPLVSFEKEKLNLGRQLVKANS